jgi:hypothetical protein
MSVSQKSRRINKKAVLLKKPSYKKSRDVESHLSRCISQEGRGLEENPLYPVELIIGKVKNVNKKFSGSPFQTICARSNRL